MSAKFLVAHPDDSIVRTLETALGEEHYSLRTARDGLDVIDRALDDRPDVIILGMDLPGLTGLDAARALRALEPTQQIPILFLARDGEEAAGVARAGLARVDPLAGPLDLARLRDEWAKALRAAGGAAGAPAPTEARAGEPDKHLAAIADPLTGLYARHYLLHRLAYEAARAARYHTSLACLLFGLDAWQDLCRKLGVLTAEAALIEMANVFRRCARAADVIGRAAAAEFLVIAPHTDDRGALELATRLKRLIGAQSYEVPQEHLPLQVSVGLAAAPGSSLADSLALLGRAEAALARARAEKDGIVVG